MDELMPPLRRLVSVALTVIAVLLSAGAFLPEFRMYATGFALGMAASVFNAFLLAYRIRRLTEIALSNTGKRAGLGFLGRVCIAVLAVIVAVNEPWADLGATVAGLAFAPAFTLLYGLLPSIRGQGR